MTVISNQNYVHFYPIHSSFIIVNRASLYLTNLEKGVEETVWKIRGGEVESRGRDTLGDKESLVTPEATPSDRIICVPGVMGVPGGGPPL